MNDCHHFPNSNADRPRNVNGVEDEVRAASQGRSESVAVSPADETIGQARGGIRVQIGDCESVSMPRRSPKG